MTAFSKTEHEDMMMTLRYRSVNGYYTVSNKDIGSAAASGVLQVVTNAACSNEAIFRYINKYV